MSAHLLLPRKLDVSAAELDTYALAAEEETLDADARRADVMLMPGCGGSAAVLGCLAGRAVDRFAVGDGSKAGPGSLVRSIDVALRVAGSMSRGSEASAAQSVMTAGNAFPGGDVSSSLPDGPSSEERQANPYHAAVRVTGTNDIVRLAPLRTVNGYTYTPVAAVGAAKRALAGQFQTGFATPAAVSQIFRMNFSK